jgi:hypothetical protein
MGTQGVQQGIAEPEAGVDVDGDFPVASVLRRVLTLEYERSCTTAERLYLSDYLKCGVRGKASAKAQAKYTLLEAVVGKGQQAGIPADGRGREEYLLALEPDRRHRRA